MEDWHPSPDKMGNQTEKHTDDVELFERVMEGDRDAFAVLYDRYSARLYGLAVRLLGDETSAADALQDVFLKVWKQRGAYSKRRGHPVVWMTVMCRNHCIDLLRSRSASTRRFAPLDEIPLRFHTDDYGPNPLSEVNLAQLKQAVEHALSTLPKEQMSVIRLAQEQGLSQTEIAEELGIALGTVKSRMRLGMAKLRKALLVYKEA